MSDKDKCSCELYKKNIDLINQPIMECATRHNTSGYTGDFFVFCPWCGKRLRSTRGVAPEANLKVYQTICPECNSIMDLGGICPECKYNVWGVVNYE